MTVLLQRVVEYAWIFYVIAAVGAVVYVARALSAHRARRLALFTLERETATSQVVQAWTMVLTFVTIGAIVFFSVHFVLPTLSAYNYTGPVPTSTLDAGIQTPVVTPSYTPEPSPTPTLAPTVMAVPSPPPASPTPLPTSTPRAETSGDVRVRFGDFAELVGYRLPSGEINTGQPLMLTLYWRKLEGISPMNYLVFTHLLTADGRLIAQHDGQPAGGTRPMDTWTAGETIEDVHPMAFYDMAYTGPAQIVIGLYDPGTGRVLTDAGQDHVVLPPTLTIVAQ